ncbi:WSC domain-containing protein 1-like isoform X2 [Eriocheir sinensis]|uniref:WSC domain-containing protein 1-like isoform X2 n=1 Tax=Eriocheir sinensis TaxID=95602 RepID=UPI0021C958CD|nr:WSC domain-containing protein 1-like isoform X2 [Eriocheir sinensis]
MGASGEAMINLKRFLCPVVVVVAITCLVLLYFSSFRQSGVTTMSEEVSKNNDTGGGAVTDMMRLLHGSVERVLVDGQLPVDPWEEKSMRLWGSDPHGSPCSKYKTRFGKRLPPVWLASFAGSGNTWTRYLLEAASGVFTGSIYRDKRLIDKGYLGENDDVTSKRTLVQKIHEIPPCTLKDNMCPENNRTIPTVLLLRNPANLVPYGRGGCGAMIECFKQSIILVQATNPSSHSAILAYYKLMESKSHVKQIPVSDFESKSFRSFVSKNIRYWTELALDRLLWTEAPLYVMHYERLVQEPIKELTALLAFLGVPWDEGRMECIASHLDGSFKRKGNAAFDPYTAEEKAAMAIEAAAVNRTLLMMGYPPLPTYH